MSSNDIQSGPVLAALRELRMCDVSAGRAQRLRNRCHRALETRRFSATMPGRSAAGGWRPRAVRIFAAAWCLLYLFETIRRAAGVYAF